MKLTEQEREQVIKFRLSQGNLIRLSKMKIEDVPKGRDEVIFDELQRTEMLTAIHNMADKALEV